MPTYGQYNPNTAFNTASLLVKNSEVRVYLPGTTTFAAIYTTRTGTAKANPFNTDAVTGDFEFYAAAGQYDLLIAGVTRRVSILPDASETYTVTAGPTHENVMSQSTYDANASDNSAAWNGAINALPSGGGIVKIPEVANGNVAQTVNLKPNVTLDGARGGLVTGVAAFDQGSYLKWTGSINGVVLKALGCEHTGVRGLNINGNGIQGVTGFFVDSVNNPASFHVWIEHFHIQQCGLAGGTDGYGIRFGQSIVNSYQMDKGYIAHGTINACGIGISFESDNAFNGGVIDDVHIVTTNRGISVLACGQFKIRGCIFGGTRGANPVHISLGDPAIGTTRYNPITIENTQAEGVSTTLFLRVAGTNNFLTSLTLIGNVTGLPCDIQNANRVLSIANVYADDFRLTGTATFVDSRGDSFYPGKKFQCTGAATKVGTALHFQGGDQTGTPTIMSSGSGVPTHAGNLGDGYIRIDTPGTANSWLYKCTVAGVAGSATWVGVA